MLSKHKMRFLYYCNEYYNLILHLILPQFAFLEFFVSFGLQLQKWTETGWDPFHPV